MEEGTASRQVLLAVVRKLLHLRRADRAYEQAGREEEPHEWASAEHLAKSKREIEAPIEGELRWRRAHYVVAEKRCADCEADGKSVPGEVSRFLAAKKEFNGLEIEVAGACDHVWIGRPALKNQTQSNQIAPDHTGRSVGRE